MLTAINVLSILVLPNAHALWNLIPITQRRILKSRDAHLSRSWTHNSTWTWSWSMSSESMNTSHFLLCPTLAWGKIIIHCYVLLLNMSNRTRQAFLYSCGATRAWTGNHYSDLHSCSERTRQNQNRDITSISRRTFGKLESSPTNQVNT